MGNQLPSGVHASAPKPGALAGFLIRSHANIGGKDPNTFRVAGDEAFQAEMQLQSQILARHNRPGQVLCSAGEVFQGNIRRLLKYGSFLPLAYDTYAVPSNRLGLGTLSWLARLRTAWVHQDPRQPQGQPRAAPFPTRGSGLRLSGHP